MSLVSDGGYMRHVGFVFWAMAASVLAAEPPADPFAFRGVKLPVSIEKWQERLPYFTCGPNRDPRVADVSCVVEGESEHNLYAGQQGGIEARAFGGTVGFVGVDVWGCDERKAVDMLSIMDQHFGKRMDNRAELAAEWQSWKRGGVEVRFRIGIDRNGNVHLCSVTYQTDGFLAESERRQKTDPEGRTKGM
jgi:hypothetical protein